MKYALTILATLAILGLLVLVFPFSGFYNVSATAGHSGVEEWYLSTLSRHSIQTRANGIAVPANLSDSTTVVRGSIEFVEMCQTCHGGPGVERSVTGQGMAPQPPNLSEDAPEWHPNEIYWILENGIKMAGMPAYGPTHSDEELWELVAFVERLPDMSPDEYGAFTLLALPDSVETNVPRNDDGHDHTH